MKRVRTQTMAFRIVHRSAAPSSCGCAGSAAGRVAIGPGGMAVVAAAVTGITADASNTFGASVAAAATGAADITAVSAYAARWRWRGDDNTRQCDGLTQPLQ